MTNNLYLDWAIMSLSLINLILLLWLGLTVLLNAEQRAWGIWLAGGGLLLGGAFFVSHSALLGGDLITADRGFRFWWRVGLSPAIVLPFAWYLLILWYSGFWNKSHAALRRRQAPWFLLTVFLLLLGGISFVIIANPFLYVKLLRELRDILVTFAIGKIPVAALAYPLYIVLCFALALDALRKPSPSPRVMGDLARQRARPWLIGTTIGLLLVGLLVGWAIIRIIPNTRLDTGLYYFSNEMRNTLAWFDLAISSLIAIATISLGQAIVSYEVFTGKTLPRRGLLHHWRHVVILAVGYGLLVGWTLALQLRLIYSLLLTAILMTLFYALLSWRSYAERERYIQHLRPFVASQRLYEQLLGTQERNKSKTSPEESQGSERGIPGTFTDITPPFRALCEDILSTQVAYLVPTGPLAPLIAQPLVYSNHQGLSTEGGMGANTEATTEGEGASARASARLAPTGLPSLNQIMARFDSPDVKNIALDPTIYGGAVWAIPLWSERGVIGMLLLGEKRDGGLYTQEEIEIARISGERLIDTQASTEMARRLMDLQRQRLRQSQVLDRQTRRVLHDEVLPSLHTAMLTLTACPPHVGAALAAAPIAEAISQLTDVHRQISNLLRDMPTSSTPEVARRGLIGALEKAVEDDLGRAFDQITWQIEPSAKQSAKRIPSLTAEVLFYAAREAIRNAARYGRGENNERPLHLRIAIKDKARRVRFLRNGTPTEKEGLEIVIEDDGVGLQRTSPAPKRTGERAMGRAGDRSAHSPVRFGEGAGSGQGLALHSTMMAVIGGSLVTESVPEEYTRIILSLPEGSW